MKKRTILLNSLTILLCIVTCVGVTFAFFADSVINSQNKVQAGTLNVDFKLLDKDKTAADDAWSSVKEDNTPIFGEDVLWEPGYTDVKVLKVENNGSLAIKWEARIVLRGELSKLANVINVYLHSFAEGEDVAYPSRRGDLANWGTPTTLNNYVDVNAQDFNNVLLGGDLAPEKSACFAIALQMDPEAGNEYQGLELGYFDIQIVATQLAEEGDFFGTDYDNNAELPCTHEKTKVVVVEEATLEKNGIEQIVCTLCNTTLAEEATVYFTKTLTYELVTNDLNGDYYKVLNDDNCTDAIIVIPESIDGIPVKEIYNGAFSSNKNITSVTIPDSVTAILDDAFDGCTSLQSVLFGENSKLMSIAGGAFAQCENLKELELPNGLTTIGSGAFFKSGLTSITIPVSVKTIADQAFLSAKNLNEIYYEGNVAQWNAISKGSRWNASIPARIVKCCDDIVNLS